jgi:predicted acetyltransferase
MEVRPLREEEKEPFARILRDAFVTEPGFVNQWMERAILEDMRGLFDDNGRLISGLRLLWHDVWLGRTKVRMAGITNVATPPEYRRKGLLKNLLREVMRQEHEKGINVSGLYPFEFSFYRKFGYELAGSVQRVTVKIPAMADFRSQSKGQWTQCTEEDWPRFKALYDRYCVGRFGRMDRAIDTIWKRSVMTSFDNGNYIPLTSYIWTDESGQDRAYIIYRMKAKASNEWDRDMRVREMVWVDEAARHEIYAFIANHDSQAESVIWNTEPGDEVYSLLANPRAATIEHEAGYMLRLLDVEKGLAERAWPVLEANESAAFSLAVRDDVLDWNDRRTYRMAARGEQVEISSQAGTEKAGLSCDVRILAQLYAGYLSPVHAARLGKLEVRSGADLVAAQRLFSPPGQPAAFMNDWW